MSDRDLFDDKQNNEHNTPSDPGQTQNDPFADKLGKITNEKGEPKYKDVETALDALEASQQFIEQLKQEKAEIEQKSQEAENKLREMGSIEDFVNRFNPKSAEPTAPAATPKETQGLSEDRVAELLEQRLSERERMQSQESNLQTVVSKLSETYGDRAAEVIKLRAKEMNTTSEELKTLAMKNPTMALSLLGDVKLEQTPNPSQSTNTPPLSPPDNNAKPEIEMGKGIARGGYSNKDLVELMRESKKYTNKRLGLEE